MVSIVHAARDIGRLREISSVLVRHGFGEVVARLGLNRARREKESAPPPEHGTPPPEGSGMGAQSTFAERLRRVLEDLGPSFVKLGQIASTRADLLPAELICELRKLQDRVPPVPFPEIREQIERSLAADLDDLFQSFETAPLAAASIAQVHRAVLLVDGESRQVVVKVQRPSIGATIESDLDLLHMLAALIERTFPETRLYSPVGLVQQFDRAIHDELDFSIEADNAARFARNFADFPRIRFPDVHRGVSSKRVLTLEFFDGNKLADAIALGCPGRALAQLAVAAMVKQVFEDGFFHADPHPGNVIVLGPTDEPSLGLVDLGMVGRLSPRMRDLTLDLMVAALRQDYVGVTESLCAIGTPRQHLDQEAFGSEVAVLAERYLGRPLGEISFASLMRDLVRLATKYGIEVPMDFILVGKALMTVEGIGKELDPELDIMEEARPHFMLLLKRRYSPERLGLEFLRRLEHLADTTSSLPHQLTSLLKDAHLGRLRLQTEELGAEERTDRLGRRIQSGLLVGPTILSGALCLSQGYARTGWSLLAFAAFWLFGHLLVDLYRHFGKRRP
jgi:ubiquinone biosynthesis protein